MQWSTRVYSSNTNPVRRELDRGAYLAAVPLQHAAEQGTPPSGHQGHDQAMGDIVTLAFSSAREFRV